MTPSATAASRRRPRSSTRPGSVARVASDTWYVYVARCADGTLYCGIARDVAARIAMHDAGTGAKYTRSRGPLEIVLVRRCRSKSTALRLEHAIKQLTRAQKERLVLEPWRVGRIVRAMTLTRRRP